MTPAVYRVAIRRGLHAAHPYAVPEFALQELVEASVGKAFDLSAYRDALEWSVAQDYIRRSTNADTDGKEWRLTDLGLAKAETD